MHSRRRALGIQDPLYGVDGLFCASELVCFAGYRKRQWRFVPVGASARNLSPDVVIEASPTGYPVEAAVACPDPERAGACSSTAGSNRLKPSELVKTNILDTLIAAAAIAGLSNQPVSG